MKSALLAFFLVAVPLAAAFAPPASAQSGSPPAANEWLVAQFTVTFVNLTHVRVDGNLAAHRAAVGSSSYTAQDLRANHAKAEQFGAGEMFAATIDGALRAQLENTLATLFPSGTVAVDTARVDRTSLTQPQGPDAYHPPIGVAFGANVDYDLAALGWTGGSIDLDEAKVRTLFELGVRAALPYNLTARPGWNATYAFKVPSWLEFAAAPGGQLSPDGSTATWQVANWQGTDRRALPAALELRARGGASQLAGPTDAHVDLDIDMDDVLGLTLPGALSGDFGKLRVNFDAKLTMRSLRLADVPALEAMVAQRLPPGVLLERLDADGLRLAVRDGLLTIEALDAVERYLTGLAEQRVAALGADVGGLEGGFAEDALAAAAISSPLDGDPPLVYAVHATFHIPLAAPEASRLQAATMGPALLQRSLSFSLPRMNGLDTSYRISLPAGIALQDIEAEGARAEPGTRDGRDFVVLTPERDDASATFTVAVTSGFALAKFWYVGLGLVLVLAAVIAVALLRHFGRRGKTADAEQPAEAQPALPAEPPTSR